MKIITYNLNGIRSAISKGWLDWLAEVQADVVCVQETKANADQLEDADRDRLAALGYQYTWHAAEKKGYSGVATFYKVPPDQVVVGMENPVYDHEGRVLRTDFGDITLLNCYFPSGTTGDIRQDFKMQFLADFHAFVQELRKTRPHVIVVGDYNIAHHPIDIHDPVGNKKSSGFLPEERAWLSQWFEDGFTAAYRYKYPDTVAYSWWSFRAGARGNNKGWRIDYISISDTLTPLLADTGHYPNAVHSDHCAVWCQLNKE